jgi:hypothetical protein
MIISRDSIKQGQLTFHKYRKTVETEIALLPKDAKIVTPHGTVDAQQGDFVGIDSAGYPYPIKRTELNATYEQA